MKDSYIQQRGDKLLFAIAIVVLVILLFRVGMNARIQTPIPNIVFTHWWDDYLEENTLAELVRKFEELHPGVNIILRAKPYDEIRLDLFHPKLTTVPGDIFALDPLWVPELYKWGVIQNPSPTLLSFINVLYYNIEILREAGFIRPPKTRTEFINYLRAIPGQGLILDGSSARGIYDDIFPWIWAAGAGLIRNGQVMISSAPVVESLSFFAALNNEGLIAEGSLPPDAGNKLEGFVSGRAAFMVAPAKNIAFVRERMGDEAFSITSIPIPDNFMGRTFFGAAGWAVGIHNASLYKEEARLFVEFLISNASVLSEKSRAIPGYGLFVSSQDPFYSKVWEIANAAEAAVDFDFAGLPWTVLEAAFREELTALFHGNASPAETAAAIQRRWTEALQSPF